MAPATLKIGVLSFWHVHAGDYAQRCLDHPATELVAVWDDDPERGRGGAQQFGAEYEPDLDRLLARPDLDGVVITTPTRDHRDVMLRATEHGKHIFTEKLLAPTVAEAEEIIAACDDHDARLVVSLPRLYHRYTAAISQLIDSGSLGRLTYGRVRLAHDGATSGWLPERFFDPAPSIGGALTDLGCHPVYLTQRFLGARPSTVSAVYGSVTGRAVEDNAVVTVRYDNGALGVIEAGFAGRSPFSIDLAGTDGWLRYSADDDRLLVASPAHGEGTASVDLPADVPDAFSQWVEHIAHRSRAEANLAAAVELTRLVVAANRSAADGRPVEF